MRKETDKDNCQVFRKQETVIKDLTDKINAVEQVQEKAKFAEELEKEVNVLLNCLEYQTDSFDCKNCRSIAGLRKATANLIIKAKNLE